MGRGSHGCTRFGIGTKLILGSGDHALTISLSALSLVHVWFLTRFMELPPGLAASVPLIGRIVDAVSDPLMGALSDRTRLRGGRRRPYFLIGSLPFGLGFALLWLDPGLTSVATRFAYFSGAYVFYSLAATLVSVPYVAILPEVVSDFDERTSVNAYRSFLTLGGTLIAAVGFRPLAAALGGGEANFPAAALVLGAWITWPWWALFAITREPRERSSPQRRGAAGLRGLLGHRNYLRLLGMYVSGRMAMDWVAVLLLFYVDAWLGRPGDFEPMMAAFLLSAAVTLPLWVRRAERVGKRSVFVAGCVLWGASMLALTCVQPEFPRSAVLALVALSAVGYGVIDMMPWSMLGEVLDEDELRSGQRRQGLYSGLFTSARKVGGTLGVFAAGWALQLCGFVEGQVTQTEPARQAVRWLTGLGPALFLLAAAGLASGYSLGRERHAEILVALGRRSPPSPDPKSG